MLADNMFPSEAIIVCDPNAVPADQRERWIE